MTTEERIAKLEEDLADLNRSVNGMRHYIGVAANYVPNLKPAGSEYGDTGVDEFDALKQTVSAMQDALKKAADYEPRRKRRRREKTS
jgi:hypothetical protein